MKPLAKLASIRATLVSSLIERDEEIDGALTALLCGSHFLMVGPPGVAKSLLCDGLLAAMPDCQKFSVLLMKTSAPEDVFGPLDVPGLLEKRYERVIDGYLPSAHISFLDEVWKASPAILNTLLKILNERKFRQGTTEITVPLRLCVAASNEYPSPDEGGKELAAIFDRFLIRMNVKPIGSPEGLRRLLTGPEVTFAYDPDAFLSLGDIDSLRSQAAATRISDDAYAMFVSILDACRAEGVFPGDRRKRQAVGAVRAYALLNGHDSVTTDDFEILSHILWDDPAEQPLVVRKIVSRIAAPANMAITEHLRALGDIVASVAPKTTKLTQLAEAVAKLDDIAKQLRPLAARSPRAAAAIKYCGKQRTELAKRTLTIAE